MPSGHGFYSHDPKAKDNDDQKPPACLAPLTLGTNADVETFRPERLCPHRWRQLLDEVVGFFAHQLIAEVDPFCDAAGNEVTAHLPANFDLVFASRFDPRYATPARTCRGLFPPHVHTDFATPDMGDNLQIAITGPAGWRAFAGCPRFAARIRRVTILLP